MDNLPKFTIASYKGLMEALASNGSHFRSVSEMAGSSAGDVFLRHDLDFSLSLALPMARAESEMGISSTYFILLSGPYNPCSAESILAMRELVGLGHELGLHYDLSLYPSDSEGVLRRLLFEIELLKELSGAPIKSIVMHEPSRGHEDFFLDVPGYVNPTYFQRTNPDLLYVSDSCRAWRDLSLCEYLNGQSTKSCLMLNTHPESWLADRPQHRITYLEKTLLPKVLEPTQRYFLEAVRDAWQTHVGPVNGYGDSDE